MKNRPVTHHDLPSDAFPFTYRVYDHDSRELLHEETVAGPGVLHMKGWAPRRVDVTITYPDGSGEVICVTGEHGRPPGPMPLELR